MPATECRGLTIIYTGQGKGKTTAALGAAMRALGHGWKVLVIQFFKGDWPVVFGEVEFAKKLKGELEVLQCGKGFVGGMGDSKPRAEHEKAAKEALALAREKISSGLYDLVILDEILYAIDYAGVGLISEQEIIELIKLKPSKLNLILTGRNAPKPLIEIADLVTEMQELKHPWQKKIPAKKGIDY